MAKDLTKILRRSDNPVRDLESTFMRQMTKEESIRWYGRHAAPAKVTTDEEGLFDEQETTAQLEDGQTVPAWLMDSGPLSFPAAPKPKRILQVPEYVPLPEEGLQPRLLPRPTYKRSQTHTPSNRQETPPPPANAYQQVTLPTGETVTVYVTPTAKKQPVPSAVYQLTSPAMPTRGQELSSTMPYTEVGLEEIMPTSADISDPLMNPMDGLTDFLLNDLDNQATISTPQVHHSPKLIMNSEAQTTQRETKDGETQTEEGLLGHILRHIERIAQTTNEQLKVAVQTQRQNQAILEEMKRVERKVTNIYRELGQRDDDIQPHAKRFREEDETDDSRRNRTSVKSTVKKIR